MTRDPGRTGLRLHRKQMETIKMSNYLNVTTPVDGTDGKTRFLRVGVAFPQRDGAKSVMKIQLDALPVNGELVLFEPNPATTTNDID
jgi:hypothetical protein